MCLGSALSRTWNQCLQSPFAFVIAFIVLVIVAVKLLICCKIFSNAGYSWALGLLMLIPIVNIIMAFFLAFADWPVHKELRSLKQKQNNIAG